MGSIPWVAVRGRDTVVKRPAVRPTRLAILVSLLMLTIALKATLATVVVDGVSMFPTLKPGQYVIIARMFAPPKIGDIVVVDSWKNDGPVVKRVFRTEGQVVAWQDSPMYLSVEEKLQPYYVPKGTVYLLGDNPLHSEDSRSYGPVPVENILGRVIANPALP